MSSSGWSPSSTTRSSRPRSATSAATTSARCWRASRRPTPSRPPVGRLRLHDQGAGGCRPRATRPTTRRCCQRRAVASSSPASSARIAADPWRDVPGGSARGRAVPRGRASGSTAEPPRSTPSRRRCRATSAASTRARTPPSRRSGASSSTSCTRRPTSAARVVTVSPDVASSTNLGGWINSAGIWSLGDRIDWFADDTDTLVRWRETDHGQHIELGIAEVNLVGLLGELGATWSRDGQPLLPIGTIYDPFVDPGAGAVVVRHLRRRAVDPRRHAERASRSARRAARTSRSSPLRSGIEQPGCVAWEPAFGQDLEWTLAACARRGSGAPAAARPTSGCRRARSTRRCAATPTGTRC